MVDGLIFSKDRPAQLRLLLDSIVTHAPHLYSSLAVLWTGSSPRFDDAYQQVFREPSPCLLMTKHEGLGTFRVDVLDWLDSAGPFVGFLVDDLVFYRDVPEAPLYDSYRLGQNCTYSYPIDFEMPVSFSMGEEGLRFGWRTAPAGDWSYPLSLDAHVYKKENLEPFFRGVGGEWGGTGSIDFVDPNTLEHGLWILRDFYAPDRLTCPPLSCAVGIPANLVNRTVANRHGDNPAETPLALLERFEAGDRLDLAAMDFSDVRGCHQEIPYAWKEPS